MEYNKEVLERQCPIVEFFVQYLAYHRGLKTAWDGISNPSSFWSLTIGGHLELASIAWCKVFGSYTEDIHWTKTPTGNTAQQAIQEFRGRILSKTGFSLEEWNDYHTRMLAMRGKYVAHLDLREPITGRVPLFDPALQVAYAYEEWVLKFLMQPYQTRPCSLSSLYVQWKTEASSIVSGHSLALGQGSV